MKCSLACERFFFSSRRRHTRWNCDLSSDVCSSDLESTVSGARPEAERLVGSGGLKRRTTHMAMPRTEPSEQSAFVAVHMPPLRPRRVLTTILGPSTRSEERRVGKECRSRCALEHEK